MDNIVEMVKKGAPIYIRPYKEPKVWGMKGIGEYWYGAEEGEKSSLAVVDGKSAPLSDLIKSIPEEILGKKVVKKKGIFLPLTKILTPKDRLSVQFHDAKSELWIVTGVNAAVAGERPSLVMGFNHEAIEKYGQTRLKIKYFDTLVEYGQALNDLIDNLEIKGYADIMREKGSASFAARVIKAKDKSIFETYDRFNSAEEKLERFYNYVQVGVGDVLAVPRGTLHALGAGIEVLEPQIPGPTQSLEDGATYPVRYYFPNHLRKGAAKQLDVNRVDEISADTWEMRAPSVFKKTHSLVIERLPGGFEEKGLEVHRITSDDETDLTYRDAESCHVLALLSGQASVAAGTKEYNVPKAGAGGEMLLVPASAGFFSLKMKSKTQVIDIFTPTVN